MLQCNQKIKANEKELHINITPLIRQYKAPLNPKISKTDLYKNKIQSKLIITSRETIDL